MVDVSTGASVVHQSPASQHSLTLAPQHLLHLPLCGCPSPAFYFLVYIAFRFRCVFFLLERLMFEQQARQKDHLLV